MKLSSDERTISKSHQSFRKHLTKALLIGGLLLGFFAVYAADGWIQGLLLVLSGTCFVVGRWYSYIKNAGPD
jgi:hypothetical protein